MTSTYVRGKNSLSGVPDFSDTRYALTNKVRRIFCAKIRVFTVDVMSNFQDLESLLGILLRLIRQATWEDWTKDKVRASQVRVGSSIAGHRWKNIMQRIHSQFISMRRYKHSTQVHTSSELKITM